MPSSFFHIICRSYINGKRVDHVEPQIVGEYTTRRDVVWGVVRGDIEDPHQIFECFADESVINDVTADIAADVREHYAVDGVPHRLVDWIESNTVGLVKREAA